MENRQHTNNIRYCIGSPVFGVASLICSLLRGALAAAAELRTVVCDAAALEAVPVLLLLEADDAFFVPPVVCATPDAAPEVWDGLAVFADV